MSTTSWEPRLVLPVSPERDHMRGRLDAPVSLVEYGDYECPFCAAAHPVVQALEAHMGDELQFVFRHFPMTTVHPHAREAAEAAETAGARGKFWAMHDTLLRNQDHLETPYLYEYAESLGINLNEFHREMTEHVHAQKIRDDFVSGVRSGVNGTPTFYLNGLRQDGAWDLDRLLPSVRRAASTFVQR